MSILFFDGFDRSTITKDLDPNYWSFEPQQPVEYEKYAFGGYSYDHNQDSYSMIYSYYSPNNAILPSGTFMGNYIGSTFGGGEALYASGNYHPGFGQSFGFLALNNLDITNSNLLAPITYIQLSGFYLPQSGQSFLSARILGIETKDTNYAQSDKPGRFDDKHPLVAFCSGNTTGLILNIVKATGNHIQLIENENMTIGLEIEQLNGISGTFDLNISDDLNKYLIRSVYTDETGYQSGNMIGRILTIDSDGDNDNPESYKNSPLSRWCHLQFGIIQTGSVPYIQIKLEDIDLLSIPANDSISDKDLWEDKIYISGFSYDNIRFFNRTYNGSISYKETRATNSYGGEEYVGNLWYNRYYMRGANTLIDDLILSDASGVPYTFIGSNAKVVPFTPGINGNVNNNGGVADGYREWTTNSSSHRIALKNADGDTGKITSSTPNSITAIRYKNDNMNISSDILSQWRLNIEDAIGGIKVYTQAKKEFLDSAYEVIMSTGINDENFIDKVKFIINADTENDTAIDRTRSYTFKEIDEVRSETGITKFNNHPSLKFENSYLQLNESIALRPYDESPSDSTDLTPYLFSLESFVHFTGSEPLLLFSTRPPTGYSKPNYVGSANYEISCTVDQIEYAFYYKDTITDKVSIPFTNTLATGEWHHIAFSSTIDSSGNYPLMGFVNGILVSSFKKYTYTDYNSNINITDTSSLLLLDRQSLSGAYRTDIDLGVNSGLIDLNFVSGTATGSGLFSSPTTGTFPFYIDNVNDAYKEIFSFDTAYSGYLVLAFNAVNTAGANQLYFVNILKNNITQVIRNDNTSPTGIPGTWFANSNYYSLSLNVASGDSIKISISNGNNDSGGTFDFYLQSGYIASDVIDNELYYLPSGSYNKPQGLFANFGNGYALTDLDSSLYPSASRWPIFAGGNHFVSDMRLTQGTIQVANNYEVRYQENFNVPTDFLRALDDDFVTLGETQLTTKTRYGKIQQFYEYNNPLTNEPWTTGLINSPSGILFGVRKL